MERANARTYRERIGVRVCVIFSEALSLLTLHSGVVQASSFLRGWKKGVNTSIYKFIRIYMDLVRFKKK